MTTKTAVECPHCGAENEGGAAFCESCGKALPRAATSPRVVGGDAVATSAAGQRLVSSELEATTKRAATALMWVAILQTVLGPVVLMVQKSQAEKNAPPGMVYEVQPIAYVIIFGIAAAFWGLFFWARRSPLPAAIVGLILFVTLHLVDAVADPTTLMRGWLMKIIVIAILSKAISAGLKHRRLLEGNPA